MKYPNVLPSRANDDYLQLFLTEHAGKSNSTGHYSQARYAKFATWAKEHNFTPIAYKLGEVIWAAEKELRPVRTNRTVGITEYNNPNFRAELPEGLVVCHPSNLSGITEMTLSVGSDPTYGHLAQIPVQSFESALKYIKDEQHRNNYYEFLIETREQSFHDPMTVAVLACAPYPEEIALAVMTARGNDAAYSIRQTAAPELLAKGLCHIMQKPGSYGASQFGGIMEGMIHRGIDIPWKEILSITHSSMEEGLLEGNLSLTGQLLTYGPQELIDFAVQTVPLHDPRYEHLQIELARNHSTPDEYLFGLACHPDPDVRSKIRWNPNASNRTKLVAEITPK